MAIAVYWSDEARQTYENNIQYLTKAWTQNEIKRFVQQTQYVISRLQEHPESYNPSAKNKKVRRARLNKHITLYYRYYVTRKEIVLISFWNTRQDPKKFKY
jgi:plasmid stabilization system protein ParE